MHIAFRTLLAFGTLVAIGLVGCAHFRPSDTAEAPEAVGALAPSYHSLAVAPVHATTDFGHAEIVQTGDDGRDAPSPAEMVVAPVATGVDTGQPPAEIVVAPAATGVQASQPPADTETPDVVAKSAHGF